MGGVAHRCNPAKDWWLHRLKQPPSAALLQCQLGVHHMYFVTDASESCSIWVYAMRNFL
jgi:3-oxoacyl-[acyl-carrier-protein] synthase III